MSEIPFTKSSENPTFKEVHEEEKGVDLSLCIGLIGSGSTPLAEHIFEQLRIVPQAVDRKRFPNGEQWIQIPVEVSGKVVLVFQDTTCAPQDQLFELFQIIQAAQSAGAQRILVICPGYPYARQEHPQARCARAPQLISQLLATVGASYLVTVDLHAPEQRRQFILPTDSVAVDSVYIPYLRSVGETDRLVFGADQSMQARAQAWARALGCDFGWAVKQHTGEGALTLVDWQGTVQGRSVYLLDDRVDTGQTIALVAARLKQLGAKRVIGIVTHGFTNSAVWDRVRESGVNAWIQSDTRPAVISDPAITILSVAPLISEALSKALKRLMQVDSNLD